MTSPMSAWQELLARFRSLEAQRQQELASRLEREAHRAAFDAWSATASQVVMGAVAERLHRRVALIQRASGCQIQLSPRAGAAAAAYGVDAIRVSLPPCHVDIYAVRLSGELPRIHIAVSTEHRRGRGRMVSYPGCTICPGPNSGLELRSADGSGSTAEVSPDELVLKALDLLAVACCSIGYARVAAGPHASVSSPC
jgi:hypothetical protein